MNPKDNLTSTQCTYYYKNLICCIPANIVAIANKLSAANSPSFSEPCIHERLVPTTQNETKQEAHHKVGLGETPRRFVLKRCRYSSLEKFEDAFDTALGLMQTKPSDAAFSAVFQTSINADRKQLVTLYPLCL